MTIKHKLSVAAMGLAAVLDTSTPCYAEERIMVENGGTISMPEEYVDLTSIGPQRQEPSNWIYLRMPSYKQKVKVRMTIEDMISHYGTPAGSRLTLQEPLNTRRIVSVINGSDGQYNLGETDEMPQTYLRSNACCLP
jgi:hypothetical protein